MRPLYRNLFLFFGLASIVLMAASSWADFADLGSRILRAGLYLPAVIAVWVPVYACNAEAFRRIVNALGGGLRLPYWRAYRLTLTAFAFTYATPFGFGGVPYRVMELSGALGSARAMSCTALYSMMHILSHFCLWLTGVLLFVGLYPELMTPLLWGLAVAAVMVFVVVAWCFGLGYRHGMAVGLCRLLSGFPLLGRHVQRFSRRHAEDLESIDRNIALLHTVPRAFWASLVLEYVGRLVNSLEYFLILRSLGLQVGVADGILVEAFVSLIGNVFFFFPMQLGAREGALAFVVRFLGFGTPALGLVTGFYMRLRELFWIVAGVLLVKAGGRKVME